eukprot:gnl/TRDRNA2_/TRDRNA2_177854_c9_seq14.p3 gnl/TRDRNA2_/TRDRNA2_177854_c9~~gnl/TRDRNA2_/TRDRNA2_177854_c9_seq14.p3  ORF type:complete len:116 (+),score=16.87 gnl/TRDRNA2_/TRDRNA2_177854_c9_seq14:62-409(+)
MRFVVVVAALLVVQSYGYCSRHTTKHACVDAAIAECNCAWWEAQPGADAEDGCHTWSGDSCEGYADRIEQAHMDGYTATVVVYCNSNDRCYDFQQRSSLPCRSLRAGGWAEPRNL